MLTRKLAVFAKEKKGLQEWEGHHLHNEVSGANWA